MRKFDLFLIFTIITSAGIIGYHLLPATKSRPTTNVGTVPKVPDLLVQNPESRTTADRLYGIFDSIRKVSEADWNKALQVSGHINGRRSQSIGCTQPNVPGRTFINYLETPHAERTVRGDLNVLLTIGGRVCHRVGDVLTVLSFDLSSDKPYVQRHGTVTIGDIVAIPVKDIAESFLSVMGLSRASYLRYLNYLYRTGWRPEATDTIVFLSKPVIQDGELATPPKSFPMTTVMTSAEAQRATTERGATIVDVRSEAEFSLKHISNSVNIPIKLGVSLSSNFKLSRSKQELADLQFDFSKILALGKTKSIIVVGSNADDRRPLILLTELLRNGYGSMGWIYDGFSSP